MAGRLAWVIAGGAAVVGGMAIQDGHIFSFSPDERHIDRAVDSAVDGAVDGAIDGREDRRIGIDGQQGEPDEAAVRAMTDAVADLVKAEAVLAAAQIGSDEDPDEVSAAQAQRDRARAEVDRLKAELQARKGSAEARQAIRDQVRSEVREAVRNN